MVRRARVFRKTKETEIRLTLTIDGKGRSRISTTIPFLDHMLSLTAAHGLFDLSIRAKGDTVVDDHHTVEDIGICLGTALKQAVGDKRGIRRYGSSFVPMDESLASVHVDLSGRPCLVYHIPLRKRKIGEFDTELVREFFQAFANNAGLGLHAQVMYGGNGHHMVESLFKALGRALREAVFLDRKIRGVPSTKGKL